MPKSGPLDTDIDRYSATARTILGVKKPVKRLGELALYTAAAGSALALAPGADASIIYNGVRNITVHRGTVAYNYPSIDLNGGGYDMSFGIGSSVYSAVASDQAVAYGFTNRLNLFDNQFGSLLKFGASDRDIGPTIGANTLLASFGGMRRHYATASGASNASGLWNPGSNASSTGFAGFSLNTGTTNSAQTHFGWLHFKVVTDNQNRIDSLTLIDWAYQSVPGESIHAGAGIPVPEPSGLGLMALGALGIAALRRRRGGRSCASCD